MNNVYALERCSNYRNECYYARIVLGVYDSFAKANKELEERIARIDSQKEECFWSDQHQTPDIHWQYPVLLHDGPHEVSNILRDRTYFVDDANVSDKTRFVHYFIKVFEVQ